MIVFYDSVTGDVMATIIQDPDDPIPPGGAHIIAPDQQIDDLTDWGVDGGVLVERASRAARLRKENEAAVDAERDRRVNGVFSFNGSEFQFGAASKQRIIATATLAGFAIGGGAVGGDLYWHGGVTPFTWIAADNSLVQMDAPTAFAFGQAAMAYETSLIFAARALKDMAQIPDDFTDDSYW